VDASVVIPTHNRREQVLRAVRALLDQDYAPHAYEIIVCCDRCTDGTAEALQAITDLRLRVVPAAPAGQAAALNAGWRLARGRLAIVIDDEAEPLTGFVKAHVLAHRGANTARIAVTGYSPALFDRGASPITRYMAGNYDAYFAGLQRDGDRNTPLDLCGSNFSITLSNLEEEGGLNESYFFQRNDFELATRLLENGYEFRFCRDAEAPIRISIDADSLVGRTTARAQNDYRLAREHPWCIPYLPFYRGLSNSRGRQRWRLLWAICGPAAALINLARRVSPRRLHLFRLEYAARYCLALKQEIGDWQSFSRLGT